MHISLKSSIAPLSSVSITFSIDRFPILTISHTHENDDGQVLSCIDHFVSEFRWHLRYLWSTLDVGTNLLIILPRENLFSRTNRKSVIQEHVDNF